MSINISASAAEFDFGISGSMPNINVDADALNYKTDIKAVFSSYPAAARNPELDITYYCNGADRFGEFDQGVFDTLLSISGMWLSKLHDAETLEFSAAISGSFVEGSVYVASLTFDFAISGDIIIEMPKRSWVRWSDIGSANFEITHENLAGERPIEWTGTIYDVLKLNNMVVIYGTNGISVMKPVDNSWAYQTVSTTGTKGRESQISLSTNDRHWYIDVLGQLWEFGESRKKLDYSEFLAQLDQPVLSLDEQNELLYICDGTKGYVYSYLDNSLAECSSEITGHGHKNNIDYFCATSDFAQSLPSFSTNIYDLGTRKEKTIFNLEFATDVSTNMEVAISYRMDHKDAFMTTPWVGVTPQGIAYLNCYGREFIFHFRANAFEQFTLDQVKINGVIHGFSFLDTVRKEN